MKKIFYILLFISFYSSAQFNIIVEDTARNHLYAQTIINSINEFTIISGASDSGGNRGISIIRTDTEGVFLWKKIISKNGESWIEGYKQSYNTELNVLSGSVITDKRRGALLFFNNNYDTSYTKIYNQDTLESVFFSCTKSYNSNIICVGQKQNLSEYANGLIVKYDSLGNIIWDSEIGNSSDDLLGIKTIETYDSSIITIGYTYTGTATYKQDWYIVKTDSLGNLDWWLHPGTWNINDGAAQDIIQTRDSCFVVVGGKAVYNDGAYNPKFDGRIMKFDIIGNIKWDKTFRVRLTQPGYDSLYCFFKSIVELDDGGFAVTASIKNNVQYIPYISSLYRFNSEGDTLWTRKYCSRCSYLNDNSISAGIAYPSTVQKTENGGFLIGGWGTFDMLFSHSYSQQMFLIKTDSLGCDGTLFSCPDTGVFVPVLTEQEGFLVFPNPATNNLQITMNNEQLGKNTSVFIYDVYGRVVRVIASGAWQSVKTDSCEQSPRNDVITIDVSHLPKGIYFIKIGSVTQKFVKL